MILVAGGSGLIGKAIADHLWNGSNVYRVWNYDPIERGKSKWLDGSRPLSSMMLPDFNVFIDCSWPKKPSDQFKTWNTVIKHFQEQKKGKIILFSSIYGHKAPDFGMYEGTEIESKPIEYAMLKAATEQATRYLAQKLKPYVQVNCIAPGGVLNKESEVFQEEYFTSGRAMMIETKNVLPVIDALLHEDNAINGQVITVDNGWTL